MTIMVDARNLIWRADELERPPSIFKQIVELAKGPQVIYVVAIVPAGCEFLAAGLMSYCTNPDHFHRLRMYKSPFNMRAMFLETGALVRFVTVSDIDIVKREIAERNVSFSILFVERLRRSVTAKMIEWGKFCDGVANEVSISRSHRARSIELGALALGNEQTEYV